MNPVPTGVSVSDILNRPERLGSFYEKQERFVSTSTVQVPGVDGEVFRLWKLALSKYCKAYSDA